MGFIKSRRIENKIEQTILGFNKIEGRKHTRAQNLGFHQNQHVINEIRDKIEAQHLFLCSLLFFSGFSISGLWSVPGRSVQGISLISDISEILKMKNKSNKTHRKNIETPETGTNNQHRKKKTKLKNKRKLKITKTYKNIENVVLYFVLYSPF